MKGKKKEGRKEGKGREGKGRKGGRTKMEGGGDAGAGCGSSDR